MKLRLAELILGFVLCLTALPLCHAEADPAPISTPPALKVGVTPNAAPIVFKQDGSIVGVEAEFAAALAKTLGRELQFVELEWSSQIPKLQDGTIDIIMSGMSYTKSRAEKVAFSDPYLTVGQMVLIRKSDADEYSQPEDLRDLRGKVGIEKGTTGQLVAERLFAHAEIVEYSSPEETADAIIALQLDAAVHDAPFVWWLASSHRAEGLTFLPFALTEEYLAWALRRDDTNLLAAVNQALEAWRQSGELGSVIGHWLPSGL